jgi:hypothetical protein
VLLVVAAALLWLAGRAGPDALRALGWPSAVTAVSALASAALGAGGAPWLPAVLIPVAVVIGALAAVQLRLERTGQDRTTGLTTSATTTNKL